MAQELVSIDYPPGSTYSLCILWKPVAKRRYAAWLGDEFLGYAIARVDGKWTGKTPCDETFPGWFDREDALVTLLAHRGRSVEGSSRAMQLDLRRRFANE
jgi:hypothetical protein